MQDSNNLDFIVQKSKVNRIRESIQQRSSNSWKTFTENERLTLDQFNYRINRGQQSNPETGYSGFVPSVSLYKVFFCLLPETHPVGH